MDDTGHSGFTLFELLVALALVALLAGQALPAMSRFVDAARLRSAAEAFARELEQARNHALTYQRSVFFSVSVASGHWCYGWSDTAACDCTASVTRASACRTGAAGRYRTHGQSSADFPAAQLDTTRSAPLRTLRFSPIRGTASADSFSLRNRLGELRVVVSPLGRVRICAGGVTGYPAC